MVSWLGVKPGVLNLTGVRGDDIRIIVYFEDENDEPIDVSDWTFAAEVRSTYSGDLLLTFGVETSDDDVTLADHEVRLSADAAVTADVPDGRWPWDLRATDAGSEIRTMLAGVMWLRPHVTEV